MKKLDIKFANFTISAKLVLSTAILILVSVFLVPFLSHKQYTRDLKTNQI